ncbi:MAG: PD-(D/E)XK nuclease domain-containing protein, partial [Thermofilum sp.]
LFQAGYLTIRRVETTWKGPIYYLGYPNKEVRVALNESLVRYYTQQGGGVERLGQRVRVAFESGRVDEVGEVLRSLFAGIPYEWYRRSTLSEYEGYYASVVYSFLAGTGLDLVAEEYTSRGRVDLVVRVEGRVYIIEFKVMEGEVGSAFEELRRKGYEEKYRGGALEVYLVGIDFDPVERNIKTFKWERV